MAEGDRKRIRDPLRFSYPADHALTAEFEEQMTLLAREYKGDGEYLALHHPDEQGAKDDAPDSTALALLAEGRRDWRYPLAVGATWTVLCLSRKERFPVSN